MEWWWRRWKWESTWKHLHSHTRANISCIYATSRLGRLDGCLLACFVRLARSFCIGFMDRFSVECKHTHTFHEFSQSVSLTLLADLHSTRKKKNQLGTGHDDGEGLGVSLDCLDWMIVNGNTEWGREYFWFGEDSAFESPQQNKQKKIKI